MTPRQKERIGKSYDQMTEQERKDWFGYCFKRTYQFPNISESYVCDIRNLENYGNGYGVIRWQENPDDPTEEYDPQCLYDIDELKQYMQDYPEMIVEGWYAPMTAEEQELTDIRTNWVNLTDDQLKEKLYANQKVTFTNDDIWNGSVAVGQTEDSVEAVANSAIASLNSQAMTMSEGTVLPLSEVTDSATDNNITPPYLITWKEKHYTCDQATTLAGQYTGDNNTKAEEVKTLRNNAKEYIRTVVDKFIQEHAGQPEPPSFPKRYMQ